MRLSSTAWKRSPSLPPVSGSASSAIWRIASAKAQVAIAKYAPRMRSVGSPRNSASSPPTTPASGSATPNGRPTLYIRIPVAYAPVPKNAASPKFR